MSDFTIHTTRSAPEKAQPILENVERRVGFVPNIFGVFAEAPALLDAYTKVQEAIAKSSFSATEREVVAITASIDNGCHYCVAAHSTMAQANKVDQGVLDALRSGIRLNDAKLEALRQFTAIMVEKRGWASESDLQALFDAGYGRQQALEVVLILGLKTLSNYTNHIADTPVDEGFAPNAWSREQLEKAA